MKFSYFNSKRKRNPAVFVTILLTLDELKRQVPKTEHRVPNKPEQQLSQSASVPANTIRDLTGLSVFTHQILPHNLDILHLIRAGFPLQRMRPRFKPLNTISAQTEHDEFIHEDARKRH